MAFIEKVTTMRRMALIYEPGNGAIAYEGVNIEGEIVLKEVDGKVVTLKESQADDFAKKRGLVVKYQDPQDEDWWEPRAKDNV